MVSAKAERFTIAEIKDSIELLLDSGYIEETFGRVMLVLWHSTLASV